MHGKRGWTGRRVTLLGACRGQTQPRRIGRGVQVGTVLPGSGEVGADLRPVVVVDVTAQADDRVAHVHGSAVQCGAVACPGLPPRGGHGGVVRREHTLQRGDLAQAAGGVDALCDRVGGRNRGARRDEACAGYARRVQDLAGRSLVEGDVGESEVRDEAADVDGEIGGSEGHAESQHGQSGAQEPALGGEGQLPQRPAGQCHRRCGEAAEQGVVHGRADVTVYRADEVVGTALGKGDEQRGHADGHENGTAAMADARCAVRRREAAGPPQEGCDERQRREVAEQRRGRRPRRAVDRVSHRRNA